MLASRVVQLLAKSARVFGDISNFFRTRVANTALARMSIVLREWVRVIYVRAHVFVCVKVFMYVFVTHVIDRSGYVKTLFQK